MGTAVDGERIRLLYFSVVRSRFQNRGKQMDSGNPIDSISETGLAFSDMETEVPYMDGVQLEVESR